MVTGRGVVSPIGCGLAAFFDGLRRALSGVDTIRSFDARAFPTRIAAEVKGLDLATLVLPDEALRRDRKSVFGLLAAREALAEAFGAGRPVRAYPPERLGVMVAAGLEVFHLEDLTPHLRGGRVFGPALLEALRLAPPRAHLQIPAHLGALHAAREAGARGAFSVSLSACAAGTQALGEAFHAIRDGALDAALTGGYDSMVNPLGLGGFSLLEALSRANELRGRASRPFDRRRDGFVLGEAGAMLVLEELEAARARGARPIAEVLGYASTLDAYRVTDPAPDQAGAIAAMRAALADARVAPEEVDYVNAHGTATRKNDPAETAALHAVFGAQAPRIPVSSTKSQVGHCIGAAGAVELLATLFALEEGMLPATINLDEPDPECDLDYVPNRPRPASVHTAISNSFGFGGQNATIVVGRLRA